MKTETMLLYGAGGIAALYFLTSSTPATATTPATSSILSTLLPASLLPATSTTTIPTPPATYNQAYYETYQYPAMAAQDPDILNPSHILTEAEANQYLTNYLDLRQGLATWGKVKSPFALDGGNSLQDKARSHWSQYGVAQKRSFLPFLPTSSQPYVAPPTVAKASGSGSNVFGDILKGVEVVGPYVAAAVAGIDTQRLSELEVETIATGSAIAMDIMPLYYQADPNRSMGVEDGITNTLKIYL